MLDPISSEFCKFTVKAVAGTFCANFTVTGCSYFDFKELYRFKLLFSDKSNVCISCIIRSVLTLEQM